MNATLYGLNTKVRAQRKLPSMKTADDMTTQDLMTSLGITVSYASAIPGNTESGTYLQSLDVDGSKREKRIGVFTPEPNESMSGYQLEAAGKELRRHVMAVYAQGPGSHPSQSALWKLIPQQEETKEEKGLMSKVKSILF